MKYKLLAVPLVLLAMSIPAMAQQNHPKQKATLHGIKLAWTAPSPAGGSGTIASYNIYRCPNTCTLTTGAFTLVTGQIATVPLTYLDAASNLTSGSTYTYAITSVDSAGNESTYSPLAVAVFTVVANPNAPGTLTTTVQ